MDSVAADTPAYVALRADGPSLEIRLSARSASSARATLEDLFACLKAAERALGEGSSAPEHPGERPVEER